MMKKALSLAALLAAAVLLLTGCGFSALRYEHEEKYTAGNAEIQQTVENLDVHWVDGGVTIVYADQKGVTLTETADKSLNKDEQMRWWLDGATLHVQYAETGLRWMSVKKRLTITLPTGTVLKNAQVSCTSGGIEAAPFYGETVNFSTTTGNIHTECAASSLNLSATTGNITFRGAAGTMALNVTTGKISAVVEYAQKVIASLTTGSVDMDLTDVGEASVSATTARIEILADKVDSLAVKSTTGSVSVRCKSAPDEARLSTTSGGVALALPDNAGFTARVDTVSGGVHVNLPAAKDGDRYVSGNGAAQITLSSVSGGITLDAYRE